MCLHPSVLLNNHRKNCREISEDKIAVCERTGSTSWELFGSRFSALKMLVPVKIFQFSDMHSENSFMDTFYLA